MDNDTTKSPAMQLCSIRIGFAVESDEQAIDYKKKIAAVLSNLNSVRISFDLTTAPPMPPMPNMAAMPRPG